VGWLWCGAARLRAAAYRSGARTSHRPPLPTLSIGNLAAGGTGKTPLLLASLDILEAQNARVGILARGYGGDEGRMLRARHPSAQLEEGADRVAGLQRLLAGAPLDLLILDDGFQHFRLQRDEDAVLLDATRPFGRCLPAGLFREGRAALRRASQILLSRADLVDAAERARIWAEVRRIRAGLPALIEMEGVLAARDLRNLTSGEIRPLAALRGMRARLAAGVGNPQSFAALCATQGVVIGDCQWMPDHHAWRREDLVGWAETEAVLVTEKDGVKLRGLAPANVWELRVDWRFLRGGEHWQGLLTSLRGRQ
jgi:tetraacyldisaccharide 4'-kinase